MQCAALAVSGAAGKLKTIIRNTVRQLRTPDFLRGRVVSVSQMFFQGGPQLGELEAGLVAQWLGAPLAATVALQRGRSAGGVSRPRGEEIATAP